MITKTAWALLLTAGLLAAPAYGAFQKPSEEQLEAAAREPALVGDLLTDASVDQAAETAKDVIAEIVNLDLEPEDRDQRVAMLVRFTFRAMPEEVWTDLAISLGKFVAASPKASMNAAIVSAIQKSIIETTELKNGTAFGNAYIMAMQTVAGAPGGGKNVPPQPPPPPVALPYEGQRLR
ncbi:MAG TPA: hypothetical protein PLJ99_07850 [Kiritimatiellia bacterium]|nr:hypothetical protein [Kiritimatiellia bacterium]